MFETLNAWWNGLPEVARKVLRDAVTIGVTTAIAAVAALNLVFPGSIDQAKAEALLVWATAVPTVAAAVWAILRVELLPPLTNWLLGFRFSANVENR